MNNTDHALMKSSFDFIKLPQNDKIIVEYIWIGGSGLDIRSKAKTYSRLIKTLQDVEDWNFDGSSTYLAKTEDSEVILHPVSLFTDPFRGEPNKLALCSTYYTNGRPTSTNFRYYADKILSNKKEENEPQFGIEQEYVMKKCIGTTQSIPLGWPIGGFPSPQGPYYCCVGAKHTFGREMMEAHYRACLAAGLDIYGTNSEVFPGQWEFQIGTCNGIETADQLWVARYLLYRVGEYFNVDIDFSPKPVSGNWNGSGCHTNYSNNKTRNDSKMESILNEVQLLENTHDRLIKMYGEDNNKRLTGKNETSSLTRFMSGVANRGVSIRIPLNTEFNGSGYYEDRRPASNMDPYVVCASIYSVTCLNNYGLDELEEHYNKFINKKNEIENVQLA